MNLKAITKALTAVFLLAFVTCSSHRAAGNGNEDAAHAAPTSVSSQGDGGGQGASTPKSEMNKQAVNGEDITAEIITARWVGEQRCSLKRQPV